MSGVSSCFDKSSVSSVTELRSLFNTAYCCIIDSSFLKPKMSTSPHVFVKALLTLFQFLPSKLTQHKFPSMTSDSEFIISFKMPGFLPFSSVAGML